MDLQSFIKNIRESLNEIGAIEIPSYPGILPIPWAHPDFIERTLSGCPADIFTFQPVCEEQSNAIPQKTDLYFTWLKVPFSSDWVDQVLKVIQNIQVQYQTTKTGGLETVGHSFEPTFLAEEGCVWHLIGLGCPIGKIVVFSKFLGENLDTPVGMLSLEVPSLAGLALKKVNLEEIPLSNSVFLKDLLALKVFPHFQLTQDPSQRTHQLSWKSIHDSIETALAERNWFTAFFYGLEGIRFLSEISEVQPQDFPFRRSCESAVRKALLKLPKLILNRKEGLERGQKKNFR